MPALKAPRGIKRLQALFENWIAWPTKARLPGGCPIDAASREYDHHPGAMRDAVIDRQKLLDRELTKTVQMAIDAGELEPGTDPRQVAFEFVGIVMVSFRTEMLFGAAEAHRRARTSFDRLIQQHLPR
jgi:hypothetical protein